jgi:hypothetical protein
MNLDLLIKSIGTGLAVNQMLNRRNWLIGAYIVEFEEAGDRTADRRILSPLTRMGMDASGEPPLFPDLDDHYNALDSLEK